MIRTTLIAAALVTLGGGAFAMTGNADAVLSAAQIAAPGVDLSNLTDAQVFELEQALSSSDTPSELNAAIRSIVQG